MRSNDGSEIERLLREALAQGCSAKIVIVTIRGRKEKSGPAENAAEPTACEEDIVTTLREVGHRLLVEQLLSEMERRGRLHGESTIRHTITRMRREHRLTREDSGNPRGFGLPEWGDVR